MRKALGPGMECKGAPENSNLSFGLAVATRSPMSRHNLTLLRGITLKAKNLPSFRLTKEKPSEARNAANYIHPYIQTQRFQSTQNPQCDK